MMNVSSSPSPQIEVTPAAVGFPLNVPPPPTPAAEANAAGGARKLPRWEELEETWGPEEPDFAHWGINE